MLYKKNVEKISALKTARDDLDTQNGNLESVTKKVKIELGSENLL